MTEEAPNPSGEPDGGPTPEARDPAEVLTREGSQRIFRERDRLKAQHRELLAANEAQASELAEFRAANERPGDTAPSAAEVADAPAWAQALVADVTALRGQIDEYRTSTSRDAIEAQVLASVPDGNHATAKALMGSLGVDFTQSTATADALAALYENHPSVMVDHARGDRPRAPASLPDGSFDLSQYEKFADVPDVAKLQAIRDPEAFNRLNGRGQGAGPRSDGYSI